MYRSARIQGEAAPGYSSGQALDKMEEIAVDKADDLRDDLLRQALGDHLLASLIALHVGLEDGVEHLVRR